MEIRALELENVKSYEYATLTFGRGTNAICGPNGAGKSTILEAIGYALFDVPPCRPITGFVREGERTGTITVTVLADDDRDYQVVRQFGGRNQYYVYDPEMGQKIVEGGREVRDWLGAQFGVDEGEDLSALFHDAVGVPQGTLTAAFLLAPEPRRKVFNPLLRVDEYTRAWDSLRETRTALSERLAALRSEIATMEARTESLPELEARAASLAAGLEEAGARLREVSAQLAELSRQKQELEATRERLQALTEEATRLDARLLTLTSQVEAAQESVERARQSEQIVAETRPGYQGYLAAQERQRELEAQEKERAREQQALTERQSEQRVKADRIRRLEMDLEVAREQAATAASLRPKAEEQERLEQELAEAQALAREQAAVSARLERERARLGELAQRIEHIALGLAERAETARQLEEQEQALEALNEELRTVRSEEARTQAVLEQLRSQREALANVQGARCPVCEGDLPSERREALLEHNSQEAAHHEALLATLRTRTAELTSRTRSITRVQRELQARLSQLPREDEYAALEADRARQEEAVCELEREVTRLSEADARASDLSERLAALGNPRKAYQSALAIAAQSTALAKNLEAERAAALALQAEIAELEKRLVAYAGLDEALATARAEMLAHAPAYQRYLQHEREARELGPRLAALEQQREALARARSEREALEAELQQAQSAFRPEEYERIAAAYLTVSAEHARLEERMVLQRSQLEETEARIRELQSLREQLREKQEELTSWQAVQHLFEFLRQVIRDAGPQVTSALVEIISHQAARLYSDIMSDPTCRLRWTEDYEVLVEHAGHERTFSQLSGGEQMAAALSVRLALLRELSDIDLVFFDEPTANLDDTRRDNLAAQIVSVKDFGQLFVVSHDDTFERETDHIIRVEKVGDRSQVMG